MLKNRAITNSDRDQIAAWIAADSDHAHRTDVNFWMPEETSAKTLHFAVEDDKGTVMYVRMERLVRVHIQFAPPSERDRLRVAIAEFAEWLRQDSKRHHYSQIIFESVSKHLCNFLYKLGYRPSPNEQVIDL